MTILTAVDGETTPSRAVERGAELASAFGVDHVVLHVMPQDAFEDLQKSTGESSAQAITASVSPSGGSQSAAIAEYTIEDGERHAAGIARDVVHATLDDDSGTVPVGRVGDPVEEVLAEADRRSARYLVTGGRQRTPVGKAVFGSKTQSILLEATLPVVTVMSEA
jgi:nucleotide-binding universal stress UspA family protein